MNFEESRRNLYNYGHCRVRGIFENGRKFGEVQNNTCLNDHLKQNYGCNNYIEYIKTLKLFIRAEQTGM